MDEHKFHTVSVFQLRLRRTFHITHRIGIDVNYPVITGTGHNPHRVDGLQILIIATRILKSEQTCDIVQCT